MNPTRYVSLITSTLLKKYQYENLAILPPFNGEVLSDLLPIGGSSWVTLDHRKHMFFGDSPTWKFRLPKFWVTLFLSSQIYILLLKTDGGQMFSSFLSEVGWGCGKNLFWRFIFSFLEQVQMIA